MVLISVSDTNHDLKTSVRIAENQAGELLTAWLARRRHSRDKLCFHKEPNDT